MTMTVGALFDALQTAIDSGLDRDVLVVIGMMDVEPDNEWVTVEEAINPVGTRQEYSWLTLIPGRVADTRFDPMHWEEP